jgi:hypothetical protein
MNTLEIDLTGYDTSCTYKTHTAYQGPASITEWDLIDGKEGRRAAKNSNIIDLAPDANRVIINIPDRIRSIDESFLKMFLGPTARKMGPSVLKEKVTILAGTKKVTLSGWYKTDASWTFDWYFQAEQKRVDARARKLAKKKTKSVWSNPQALFVPDIGTKLKLTIPWHFDLHYERRNDAVLELVTGKKQRYVFDDYGKSAGVVTVQPNAILIVDRVYIRQGSGFEDFSSLTFRMEKGAEIEYNGNTWTTERNLRFWAKLRQVNTMLAEMDLNSLPGQEKEGIARK